MFLPFSQELAKLTRKYGITEYEGEDLVQGKESQCFEEHSVPSAVRAATADVSDVTFCLFPAN